MNGFNQVLSANETALNSSGSAANENAKYMDSLKAKVTLLKKAWDDLVNNTIKSGFVASLLEAGTALLKFANSDVGTATIQAAALGASLLGVGKILNLLITAIKSSGIALAISKVITTANTATEAFNILSIAMLKNPLFIGVAAISAITGIILALRKHKQALDEEKESVERLNSVLDVQTRTYKELKAEQEQAIKNSSENATAQMGEAAFAEELTKELDKLQSKENLTNLERMRSKQIIEQLNGIIPNLNASINETTGKLNGETSAIYKQIEAYKALIMVKAAEEVARGAAQRKIEAELNKQKAYESAYKTTSELPNIGEIDKGTYQWYRNQALDASLKSIKENNKIIADADKEIENAFKLAKKYNQNYGNLLDEVNKPIETAQEEVASGGGGTTSSAKTQLDILKEQSDVFNEQIEILAHQLFLLEKRKGSEEEQIVLQRKIQLVLNKQANWFRQQGLSDESEYIRDLQQKWWSYEDSINAIYEKIAKDAEEAAQKIKDDAINAIDDILDELNKKKDDMGTALSYVQDFIDKQVGELEKQKDYWSEYYDSQIKDLQDVNNELNDQLELQKAIENLASAKAQKKLVYKDGSFQYVSDIDAVSKAQSELSEIQRQQEYDRQVKALEQAKDDKLAALDAEIQGWKDYKDKWAETVDSYTQEQNKLIAEQILGKDIEQNILNQRLDNIQKFADEYKKTMQEISSFEQQKEGISNGKLSDQTIKDMMAQNSAAWHTAGTQAEKDALHAANEALNSMLGSGGSKYDPSSGKWYANGTTNAAGGISKVGENGAEFRVLNRGDGIIPATLTSNLMQLGRYSPTQWFSQLKSIASNGVGSGINISVANVTLPNVRNAQDFTTGLKNLAYQYSAERA